MIREGLNDCECDGIAEQTAQPRLSITVFLHRASLSRFRNSGNVEMNTVMSSPNSAQLTGGNEPVRGGNASHRRIIATVIVRMIPNVSRKAALKLNARQLAQSATIRSPGIYWICRVCDNRKRQ
jgi:hypothetical protein